MSCPTPSPLASEPPRPASPGMIRRCRAALQKSLRVAGMQIRRASRGKFRRLPRHELAARWDWLLTRLLRLGGASADNRITLMSDGDVVMESIWNAIDAAHSQVWVETYILEPDRVGTRTIDALTGAAKRGCEVLLLYDSVGGTRITESFIKPLRDAGGRIFVFNPLLKWKRINPLLRRDHRKIIVIDGRIGFCGGVNLSEDYGSTRHGNGRFHDAHVKVEGPCVRDLAVVLASSVSLATDGEIELPLPRRSAASGGTFVQVLGSRGREGRRAIQRSIRLTVRHASQHCWITTPYFIPPARLMGAINRAATRGVDVHILTAGDSDVPIVRAASQHIYGLLLKRGVRIHEMFGVTLHAKTMTIDGVYSTVGSFNLDTWSDKRNLEVMVGLVDADVARLMREQFARDLALTREVTLETWKRRTAWQRFVNWAAYQLMRI